MNTAGPTRSVSPSGNGRHPVVVDGYAHIGLPRFQSVEDALDVMDQHGIDTALVCPFESCPDLARVHQAITDFPDRFVAAGIPLGVDRRQVEAGVDAQFEAGFSGLRLSGQDVQERPWLLQAIARHRGFALVCGNDALAGGARNLLQYLDSEANSLVVAAHCAGPTDPAVFHTDPYVAQLFAQPQFTVVLSRQGHFPEPMISRWIDALVDRVGWSRLMWGSEAPVLYWRDDSVANAMSWFDRFDLEPESRAAFFGGNAERLVLSRKRSARELRLPFDPWDHELRRDVPTWPFGLPMDTELVGPLVHGWLNWGGSLRGPLHAYLGQLIRREMIGPPDTVTTGAHVHKARQV